jgi:hypothetical protein
MRDESHAAVRGRLRDKSNARFIESDVYRDMSFSFHQSSTDWSTTCATCSCSRHPLRRHEPSRMSRAIVRLRGASVSFDEAGTWQGLWQVRVVASEQEDGRAGFSTSGSSVRWDMARRQHRGGNSSCVSAACWWGRSRRCHRAITTANLDCRRSLLRSWYKHQLQIEQGGLAAHSRQSLVPAA